MAARTVKYRVAADCTLVVRGRRVNPYARRGSKTQEVELSRRDCAAGEVVEVRLAREGDECDFVRKRPGAGPAACRVHEPEAA